MSKIICDVCGTSYPDTTTQCPICGCVRSADVEAVVAGEEATETVVGSTYTYVKGGRFSKANVKKRNSGKPVVTTTAPAPKAAQTKPATTTKASDTGKADLPEKISNDNSGKKSNIGLIIVIVILSLAIVAVLSYIAVRYIAPIVLGENAGNNISEYVPVPDNETDAATDPVNPDVSCTGITLSDVEVFLISAGDSYMLTVTAEPTNTTDEILFA
ncbi:MAG: hypothetical protein IIU86_05030, partial [Oscillospiraceae bacterium]|nr:hypothetical protein [Oscillospiraceae bacterium]